MLNLSSAGIEIYNILYTDTHLYHLIEAYRVHYMCIFNVQPF